MDSVSEKGGKMVESDEQSERDSGGGAAMAALHQCELIQNMIEISISSLQGLRTKCAASNDLTQQEIRTLEVKLMKYICKQLQVKQKVPETERPQALDSYPRLGDWLRTVNLRPELIEACAVPASQAGYELLARLGCSLAMARPGGGRFSKENRENIDPYTFLPFGMGPRNCIGMRFALQTITLVIVEILQNFSFVTCKETEAPLELFDNGFITPTKPIKLKLVPHVVAPSQD
eukprot:XP_013993615.1 PREDICTED: kinase suppressor of Ras 1-like [Salmo salar]